MNNIGYRVQLNIPDSAIHRLTATQTDQFFLKVFFSPQILMPSLNMRNAHSSREDTGIHLDQLYKLVSSDICEMRRCVSLGQCTLVLDIEYEREKSKQCTSSAKMNGSILESDSRGLKLDVTIRVDRKLAHDIMKYSMGSRVRLAKDVYYLGIE